MLFFLPISIEKDIQGIGLKCIGTNTKEKPANILMKTRIVIVEVQSLESILQCDKNYVSQS